MLYFFCISGCNVINPKEEIPTYVQVDSFQMIDSNSMGGITHKIRSIFTVYNGQNVGSFDLPAKIPILASGTKELLLYAGVDNSGLYSYQIQYPHYEAYKTNLTAMPGKVVTVMPQTRYTSLSKFYYVETFENGNDFIALQGAAPGLTNPGEELNGGKSGKFLVDSGGRSTVVATTKKYVYVNTNSDPFLELDYQSTAYLQVGVYAENGGSTNPYFFLTILPSAQRNKLYMGLRQGMAALGNSAANFHLVFQIYPAEGQTTGSVILDNLKVVVF